MRIALLGQAAFAEKALAALVDHGDEIVHVFAPPDSPAGKADPLAAKARAMGIPLSQPKSFKNDAAFEHFKTLDADLAILAFVTLIVPDRILYAPRYKSICFHPSLLPRHRGASGINWAIIQGDAGRGSGRIKASTPARSLFRKVYLSPRTIPWARFTSTRSSRWALTRWSKRST